MNLFLFLTFTFPGLVRYATLIPTLPHTRMYSNVYLSRTRQTCYNVNKPRRCDAKRLWQIGTAWYASAAQIFVKLPLTSQSELVRGEASRDNERTAFSSVATESLAAHFVHSPALLGAGGAFDRHNCFNCTLWTLSARRLRRLTSRTVAPPAPRLCDEKP